MLTVCSLKMAKKVFRKVSESMLKLGDVCRRLMRLKAYNALPTLPVKQQFLCRETWVIQEAAEKVHAEVEGERSTGERSGWPSGKARCQNMSFGQCLSVS